MRKNIKLLSLHHNIKLITMYFILTDTELIRKVRYLDWFDKCKAIHLQTVDSSRAPRISMYTLVAYLIPMSRYEELLKLQ